MVTKKLLQVAGMHCKSCEIMVRDAIEEIDGCHVESISSKTGKLSIMCSKDIPEESIQDAIHQAGYALHNEWSHWITKNIAWGRTISWLLLAGVLLYLLFQMDISRLLPSYEKLWFTVAFFVGLVASISTCLAVTGWIVVGYTESIVDKTNGWKTQLRFHIGRIITFIVWGFVLGMIGKSFSGSIYFNGFLSIFVGFVLAYLGIQLLGLVPNISRWGFHLPMGLSKNITKLKNPKYAPWVGALTLLLPCGFTQGMMLFAIESGNPWQGALVMGAFALGTFPVLYTLGLGTEYVKDKLKVMNPFIASLLLVFGVFTATNGWNIIQASNLSAPANQIKVTDTSPGGDTETPTNMSVSTEEVSWGHDGYGFAPKTLTLAKWKNYHITVTPTSDGLGCFYSVILPGGREQYIKKWEAFTFSIDGTKPQKIRLVCGSMGMGQGQIVIQ